MMAAYYLTPIYTSSEKRTANLRAYKRTCRDSDQITPDEGTRQGCRNLGSMNCNFSVTFIKSLNQSSVKPCLNTLLLVRFTASDVTTIFLLYVMSSIARVVEISNPSTLYHLGFKIFKFASMFMFPIKNHRKAPESHSTGSYDWSIHHAESFTHRRRRKS